MPGLPCTNYGRDKLWLDGCLGSETKIALSQTGGVRRLSGTLVKSPRLGECSAGRAPTLHRIHWHLPYN